MSVGSKVVLLVSLGFIGFLVWFYGGSPEHQIEPLASAGPATEAPASDKAALESKQAMPIPETRDPIARVPDPTPSSPPPNLVSQVESEGQPDEIEMGARTPLQTSTIQEPVTSDAGAGRGLRRPVATTAQGRPSVKNKPTKTVETTATTPATITKHVVAPGETLSEISLRYYGSVTKWDRIVSANPGVDPDRLRVGRELKIPPAPVTKRTASTASTPSKPSPGTVHHTVETGDSLSSISLRYYGKEYRWDIIFNANSKQLSGNPDRLKIGMVLVVPLES